jgi:hypothetical protein
MSARDRRAKLDRDHPSLSMRRQCSLLGLTRSGPFDPHCEERGKMAKWLNYVNL